MSAYDILITPFADYGFMRRALVGIVALAFGAGPIGVFLTLRRMSLVGDAMAHAILPGAALGYLVGGLVNYLLNRAHTFTTDRSHVQAGLRFAGVMAVGFSLTGLFMWVFTQQIGLPGIVARVITTGLVFCWNFGAHKLWTFGERRG
jgi:ABC-type Mn2+/Zn2+ transport system permease subunit